MWRRFLLVLMKLEREWVRSGCPPSDLKDKFKDLMCLQYSISRRKLFISKVGKGISLTQRGYFIP